MGHVAHIPVFRLGETYRSLDTVSVKDHRDGAVLGEMSVANPGIIRRDMLHIRKSVEALRKVPYQELVLACEKAAKLFMEDTLPFGIDGETQSPQEYVTLLSATSGMPENMCWSNMRKIEYVLANMQLILKGLTRDLDLSVLDQGMVMQHGIALSFFPVANSMGVVMPSNSPGVNSLWVPSPVLKVPVILKPGSQEPWTPWRVMQAMIKAGVPKEGFGFYPTTHEGADTIMHSCGKAIIFGDQNTVDRYRDNPRFNVHGPGYSKVLLGADAAENYENYLDVLVDSVSLNSGRSCVNASMIVTPKNGRELADALAQRLAQIQPRSLKDEHAQLSAFATPAMAEYIDSTITEALTEAGAEEVSQRYRQGDRKELLEGSTFLQPSVVFCEDRNHPLVNREFLFPFATVVEVPEEEMLDFIGPTLVASVISDDETFMQACVDATHIDRLNIGAMPTPKVNWDQPHEGNLFEFLYRRRSIQGARKVS
jgi:acyl-CoA reductase-like NAD-dependent aldehyde dehydrogenase